LLSTRQTAGQEWLECQCWLKAFSFNKTDTAACTRC
jgi:hypothetical protein